QVFPNPVTDLLTVESETPISEITVFDLTGKEVLRNVTYKQGAIVSFQSCPAGVYFIQITTEKDKSVKKIIKY
ncbi:MAG: T9SS type A sorting domain-containing protein, partial [Bacteroidales bacterium]|nr:T9SS type A sorting domain-containing protein [Bacteroidales bacterium]